MELKEVIEYLGFDPATINSIDDFKKSHDGTFLSRNNIEQEVSSDKELQGKIFGKRLGSAQTKALNIFKSHAVEFSPEEIKDKQLEEIFELGVKKQVDLATKAINDLKNAQGEPTKAVKEWEEKYRSLESKFNGQVDLTKTVQSEYEQYKNNVLTEKKTGKVKSFVNEAWNGFKWAGGVDDLRQKGFKSLIGEKYQVQLDDKEEPYVTDQKGERIKSTKKAGEWKTFTEVLEEEGLAAKVYAAANNKGTPPVAGTPPARQTPPPPAAAEAYIHPNARVK